MNNTIPHFITERMSLGERSGSFNAYVLFADISGFTELTRKRMSRHGIGIEELTDTINGFFDSIIDSVYMNGGWVGNFAGDAITAYFQESKPSGVVNAARMITNAFSTAEVPGMAVRVVISHGLIEWMIFSRENRHAYAFFGLPLMELAEKCIQPLNTIRAAASFADIAPERIDYRTGSLFFVAQEGIEECSGISRRTTGNIAENAKFEDKRILESEIMGEFRFVASVFVNVDGADLRSTVEKLMVLADEYDGYLNKIDTGDKGTMMLVLFGAPRAVKNPSSAAMHFALSASCISGCSKVGVSAGRVYAGFMGSGIRMEFTVMGDSVNMAARYCMNAEKWRVLTDKQSADAAGSSFIFRDAGVFNLKGAKAPVNLYRPEPNNDEEDFYIERTGIDDRFRELMKTSKDRELHVSGEPGIGKTMLLKKLSDENRCILIKCRRNSTYSLQPFIDYLKRSGYATASRAVKSAYMRRMKVSRNESALYSAALDWLLEPGPPGRAIAALSEPEKNSIIQEALSAFIASEADECGALAIDNAELLDSDSLKTLRLAAMANTGMLIVAASRDPIEGLVHADVDRMEMRRFSLKETSSLIGKIADITEEAEISIYESSGGLPEYIPYYAKYIVSHDVRSKGRNKLNVDIETCLLSLADALTGDATLMLRVMSVFISPLNPEQTAKLFRKFESGAEKELMNKGILVYENGNVSFRDERMKSAVYGTILQKDLRGMHREAGDLVSESAESAQRYLEAAYHYRLSGDRSLAIHHTRRAADYFRDRMMISDSLKQRALLKKYIRNEDERAENDLACAEAYFHLGDYKKAEKLSISAMRSKKTEKRAAYTLSNIFMRTGRQKRAEELLGKIIESADTLSIKEVRNSYNSLGVLHLNRKEWSKAISLFTKSSAMSIRMKDRKGDAMSRMNKALVYIDSGKPDKALQIYEEARRVFEEENDMMEIGRIEGNIGQIYYVKGQYERAYEYFKKKHEISRKLGYRRGVAIALGNMGAALIGMKKYKRAEKMLLKKKEMDIRTGNIRGLRLAYENLAELYSKSGRKSLADEAAEALKALTV